MLHHVLSGWRLTPSSSLVNLQGQLSVSSILWCIDIESCPGRLRVKPPGPAPIRQVMAMHSWLFTMWTHFMYQLHELWFKYYVNIRLCCVLPILENPSQFPAPSTTPRPEHYFHYVAYSPNTIIFTGDTGDTDIWQIGSYGQPDQCSHPQQGKIQCLSTGNDHPRNKLCLGMCKMGSYPWGAGQRWRC